MSRIDPKNREEAFMYQFEDDMKILSSSSKRGEEAFEKAIDILESHIKAYRSKRLKNAIKKVQNKTKEREAYMKKNYGI